MTLFPEIQDALVKAAATRGRSTMRLQWQRAPRRGVIVALATLTVSSSAIAAVAVTQRDSRADAYLQATSRELESTHLSVDRIRAELAIDGREVDEIRRELVIDGREAYALEGPAGRCILIAGIGQPAGKSESIGCQPSNETKPLGTSIALRSGEGTVHLVWTGPSPQAVSAQAGGRRLATRSGPTILAVSRPDPDAAGTVTWTTAGQPKSVNLISARELDPRRRAANASAATASR